MVRRARETDVDAIIALTDECYPGDPYNKEELRTEILWKHPAWVWDENGIQAVLVSQIDQDNPYIWSVSTRSTHRGRGIATLLLNEFEKYYRAHREGYTCLWLHTRVENPAQKLYFNLGYRVTAVVPNLYAVGQHGLTMKKHII